MRNLGVRAGLFGLVVALLAGGWMAFAPVPASADGGLLGNHANFHCPMFRVGSSIFSNTGGLPATIPTAGQWQRGPNANSFDLHVRRFGCGSNAWPANGVGATEINTWELRLNSTTGQSGTTLTGATFGVMPSSFPQRNTADSTSNPRTGGNGTTRVGTDGRFSRSGIWTVAANGITFTVPNSHTGDVYLLFEARGIDNTSTLRHWHLLVKFTPPTPPISAHPLVMPADTLDGTDLFGLTRAFAAGGASQQATANLRAAAHSDTYTAGAANAAPPDFDSATITIASDAAGENPIAGAVISSDAAGNTALSACDETSAGNTCTIQSASWPASGTTTDALNFYFSVPTSPDHGGDAYVVLKASKGGTEPRAFANRYTNPYLEVFPLAVPLDSAAMPETGDATLPRPVAAGGAAQQARVFLRSGAHSNAYIAAETNVAGSAFDSATITIASDAAGQRAIAGAKISSDAEGTTAIGACDEPAVGNACTIQSANWPATGGTTDAQDIYFSVPSSHRSSAYLVVSAVQSSQTSPTFAAEYLARNDVPEVQTATTQDSAASGSLRIAASGAATPASAYLAALTGQSEVRKWVPGTQTWTRYSTDMDTGDVDFPIAEGDVLLVGAADPSSVQIATQGRPIGISTQVQRAGVTAIPFANLDATAALTLTATNGTIVHEQLCPHIEPEHPLDDTAVAMAASCTITRADLMAFHGADDANADARGLDFVYIPSSGSTDGGSAKAVWKVDRADYEGTLIFPHAPAPDPNPLEVSAFLDWADKGTDYATAGPTAMFAIGRSGTDVDTQAMPSGLAWARFNELEDADPGTAVRLSINRGTISYNGADCTKADDDAPCRISLTLTELMAERLALDSTLTAADLTGNLRVGYSLPIATTATLTIEAWANDATTPVSGTLELGMPRTTAPTAAVTVQGDPDRMIAPGQTAEIAAGFQVAVAESGDGWGCAGFGPSFLELTAPLQFVDACLLARSAPDPMNPMDPPAPPALTTGWLADEAYLVINGPASFEDGGGKRLSLGSTWSNLRCGLAKNQGLADAGDRDVACWVTNAMGQRPKIIVDADAGEDLTITANIVVADGRMLRLFTGPGESLPLNNRFADASAFHLPGPIFGSGEIKVGAVKELDRISLGRKPVNETVPTGTIPAGMANTELRLSILNENGLASRLSSVSSITVFTTGGGTLKGYGCDGAVSCSISLSSSSALAAAVARNAGALATIDLDFTAPTRPGAATVLATVVGTDGTSFEQTIDLVISGPAATLSSGGGVPRVHSMMTADDDRDVIKIPVSASDAGGNAAPMPANATAMVRNADGATLPSGSHSAEVECEGTTRYNCNVVVAVLASAANPLASGAYTATVSGSGIAETQLRFTVAGPTETVSLEIPEQLGGLAESFPATARAEDKDGTAVADGTWVTFSTTATQGGGTPTVIISSPVLTDHDDNPNTERVRRAQTKDGAAAANATIVGRGVAVLTATADGKSDSLPIDTRVAATPSIEAASSGGDAAADGLAIYRGAAITTAAAALALGPEGSTVVWLWNGKRWLRYGETEGEAAPGSETFIVLPNDILWFSGS